MSRCIPLGPLLLTLLCGVLPAAAQAPSVAADAKFSEAAAWTARWIEAPQGDPRGQGSYLFRKVFSLGEKPEAFVVNISADNRYRLFVNGRPAGTGPARGSLNHWYYDTLDIAGLLKPGKNTLAAVVWNLGVYRPAAQQSLRTGLLVQGASPREAAVNTGPGWKALRDEGWSALFRNMLAGGMEAVDGARHPWGWESPDFDDSGWPAAALMHSVGVPTPASGSQYGTYEWTLVPRDIPLMEEGPEPACAVRRAEGIPPAQACNLSQGVALEIPPGTRASILLDRGVLTSAYPECVLSGGKGAEVRLRYAENLVDAQGRKGDRNDIAGKTMGDAPCDIFRPDGGQNRCYRPLGFRTYRFVQMDIETRENPLTVEAFRAFYTGYPLEEQARFSSSDASLRRIWDVAWRTARLCAWETYFDCPYYERLQYTGDTRIQALISLYVAGDARLMRKAILAFDLSRGYEGLTLGRAPCHRIEFIPPFSLYWIGMIEDYRRWRDDPDFLRARVPGVRAVLEWYRGQIDPATGFLRAGMPYWNFVDWVSEWPRGVPPESAQGGSAVISLQLVAALDEAASLFDALGLSDEAGGYRRLAASIKTAVYRACWNPARGLLRDCPGCERYSQHANIMGILTNCIPARDQRAVFERMTDPAQLQALETSLQKAGAPSHKLARASFYYSFYLTRAMKQVGLADRYLDSLGPWRQMLDKNCSTFPETADPSRSECHAWSASPICELLSTVCGVEPDAPGFARVKIEPALGALTSVSGTVPHPEGPITLTLSRTPEGLRGLVHLPGTLSGRFCFGGQTLPLHPGDNPVRIPAAASAP